MIIFTLSGISKVFLLDVSIIVGISRSIIDSVDSYFSSDTFLWPLVLFFCSVILVVLIILLFLRVLEESLAEEQIVIILEKKKKEKENEKKENKEKV